MADTKAAETPTRGWSLDDLKAIVEAGLPIQEARALLTEGFDPEEVLSLAESAKAAGGSAANFTREDLREVLAESREAMRQIMIPENKFHPGISVFSHPDGDAKSPKPSMPYELLWNGYPVHQFPETETWDEWAACASLAPLLPGEYKVLRNDLSPMKVTVTGQTDADGKPTKIQVEHPQTREDKDKIPPKDIVVHQMRHQDNLKAAFADAMQKHLARLVEQV